MPPVLFKDHPDQPDEQLLLTCILRQWLSGHRCRKNVADETQGIQADLHIFDLNQLNNIVMKDLGQRLTEARKAKGLSQESLAEEAGISLRNLQRIENEGTNPHGDTLKRLAGVLDISLDELLDNALEENYNYIRGMHYIALTFVVLPLANIFLPVIFWIRKKDKVKDLNSYARNLLNWQVTWSILTLLPMFALIPGRFFPHGELALPGRDMLHGLLLYPFIMIALNFVYTLVAGLMVSSTYRNLFPVAIRFIR